jgi:hypothetical protein
MMVEVHSPETPAIVAAYDFSQFRHIVDVGGGHGMLLSAIIAAHPQVRGTLFDLPEGVDAAKRGAGGPLPGVTFTAGDVFETVPDGADAYLFRHLLHDYDDDDCIKMLKNVRRAMKPDSRVLVLEKTVPTDDTPGPGRWLDLHVMLLTGGRERTVPEYQALFGQGRAEARAGAADRASGGGGLRSGRHPGMNAVEYCLLHGRKVAGTRASGAVERGRSAGLRRAGAARQPIRGGTARGRRQTERPGRHADARHARPCRDASRRDGRGRNCSGDVEPRRREELEQISRSCAQAVLVIDGEFAGLAAAAIAKVSPQTRLLHRERELAGLEIGAGRPACSGAALNQTIRRSG